jgi:hypothetical protein
MPHRLSTLQRLLGFIESYEPDTDSCIKWIRYKNPAGYGQLRVENVAWLAHRYVYTQLHGNIPPGLVIMHTCDNPACVNPRHLQLGTHGQNVRDKEAKGRGNAGERNGQAKLSQDEITRIRDLHATGEYSFAELGRIYEVHRSCIFKIVNKLHWKKS